MCWLLRARSHGRCMRCSRRPGHMGVDGTSVFFPCVAVALWIIHFASGQGWPAEPPSLVAWLFVFIAAAAIGGGYACWGYGILHGSMERLAIASYATPVLHWGQCGAIGIGVIVAVLVRCVAGGRWFGAELSGQRASLRPHHVVKSPPRCELPTTRRLKTA